MKIFLGTIGTVGLLAIGSISIANAQQQANSKSFAWWCQQKQAVSADARNTIDVMLEKVKTNDCQQAELRLRSLKDLNLNDSRISDLNPIAGLNNLIRLQIDRNRISDLKPIAGLKNLIYLSIEDNQISDLKPLAELDLLSLSLRKNRVSDIKPLAGLVDLTNLSIESNRVGDIQPIA
uniref:leucine-rich repeat domain-containing protein n=1 Tax=Chamaesiphon sp. VAR_48_metabat_403 TaxID=2964700 RepID=UPI00286E1A5B